MSKIQNGEVLDKDDKKMVDSAIAAIQKNKMVGAGGGMRGQVTNKDLYRTQQQYEDDRRGIASATIQQLMQPRFNSLTGLPQPPPTAEELTQKVNQAVQLFDTVTKPYIQPNPSGQERTGLSQAELKVDEAVKKFTPQQIIDGIKANVAKGNMTAEEATAARKRLQRHYKTVSLN